jgi:hypothetical protein
VLVFLVHLVVLGVCSKPNAAVPSMDASARQSKAKPSCILHSSSLPPCIQAAAAQTPSSGGGAPWLRCSGPPTPSRAKPPLLPPPGRPTHVLTNKICIHLRSTSVRTYTFSPRGFPRFLSICRARRLQALDLALPS